jgi:hypothetical protein
VWAWIGLSLGVTSHQPTTSPAATATRIAAFDHVAHESPRTLDRRRFEERKISSLPRDKIERPVNAIDMVMGDRNNFG